MKKFYLYILFSLITFLGYSQSEEDLKAFDSVFYDIAVNVTSSSPTRALHLADSLFTYSSNDKQRLKSLMLKADILEKQERRGEAIQHAQQALQVAVNDKDYSFQARIYGFLSTQYRMIGFFDKGTAALLEFRRGRGFGFAKGGVLWLRLGNGMKMKMVRFWCVLGGI